jgi:FkbM family methyltransferase
MPRKEKGWSQHRNALWIEPFSGQDFSGPSWGRSETITTGNLLDTLEKTPRCILKVINKNMKIKKIIKTVIGTILPSKILTINGIVHVPDNTIPEIKSKIFLGTYEYAEIKLLKKYIPKNNSVIELGGSIGVVTKHIQNNIDKENIIISVEANPKLLVFIQKNTSDLTDYAKVFIENAAICNSDKVFFDVSDSDTRNNKINNDGGILVNGINITKILEKYSIKDCSLVVDIEGEEHDLVEYDKNGLRYVKNLIIEMHGEIETINNTLNKLNYDCLLSKSFDVYRMENGLRRWKILNI